MPCKRHSRRGQTIQETIRYIIGEKEVKEEKEHRRMIGLLRLMKPMGLIGLIGPIGLMGLIGLMGCSEELEGSEEQVKCFHILWFNVVNELRHVLDEGTGAITQYGLLGGIGGSVVLVTHKRRGIFGGRRWRLVLGHRLIDIRDLS